MNMHLLVEPEPACSAKYTSMDGPRVLHANVTEHKQPWDSLSSYSYDSTTIYVTSITDKTCRACYAFSGYSTSLDLHNVDYVTQGSETLGQLQLQRIVLAGIT